MAWPHTFGALAGTIPLSYLDDNFTAAAFAADVTALTAAVAALPSSTVPLTYVAAGNAGISAALSRVDHRHPPQSAAPTIHAGATYTVTAVDDGGVHEFTNAAGCVVTFPNTLAVGFSATYVQAAAAGQVTFAAGAGSTQRQASGYTKTRAQWSVASMYVRANAGGVAAEYILSGDMSA